MKIKIVNLIGDPAENLYQLGTKEREAFFRLEERVQRLLSTNSLIRIKNDFMVRLSTKLKKKEDGFFQQCIEAYAQGLGIDGARYMSFISVFELAAHYGQIYPELKGLLPGCTSVFHLNGGDICHSRLLDFPLTGIFEETTRLYHWKLNDHPVMLSYSCEGLAPLFFQAIHEKGISYALHHKPGFNYYQEGKSIFQIAFDTLFGASGLNDLKRETRKMASITKWGILLLDHRGQVLCMDIDGPNHEVETYDVTENSPLIFTNLPIKPEPAGLENYLNFCKERQQWLMQKLQRDSAMHPLDLLTDVKDQKLKKWLHPAATLSTTGAIHVNLSQGHLDVKEGSGALVHSDAIIRFNLGNSGEHQLLKEKRPATAFESAWKRASLAQAAFDQGKWDEAYHELQMSIALMPHPGWKEILKFYLYLWDFSLIGNQRELSLIYNHVKKLKLPSSMKDQWLLLCMRLERQLQLMLTVSEQELSPQWRNLFIQETQAPRPLFLTWMKSIHPRMELLEVFSPHYK
jgi:hypothetical protein